MTTFREHAAPDGWREAIHARLKKSWDTPYPLDPEPILDKLEIEYSEIAISEKAIVIRSGARQTPGKILARAEDHFRAMADAYPDKSDYMPKYGVSMIASGVLTHKELVFIAGGTYLPNTSWQVGSLKSLVDAGFRFSLTAEPPHIDVWLSDGTLQAAQELADWLNTTELQTRRDFDLTTPPWSRKYPRPAP